MQDELEAAYSGLGHLVSSAQRATGVNTGGYPQVETSSSTYAYDALGNSYQTTSGSSSSTPHDSFWDADASTSGSKDGTSTYAALTGRLLTSSQGNYIDHFFYDAAGSTTFQWGTDPFLASRSDLASFYGADGKLRTVDRRNLSGGTNPRGVWEEYRYDALGRRVWVRTLNWCQDSLGRCELKTVRRTVWDGDQALYEIQMQEAEQENDGVPAQTAPLGNDQVDPDLITGRVLHTYGPGIDQPLSTIRLAFVGWQQFAVIPVWDTQGRAPYILFADGTRQRCLSSSNCLNTHWLLGFRAYGSRTSGQVLGYGDKPLWLGNVLEDQHDASGLLYRRNRYYNPQSGRFTQEDPIGLAGGVNVYGFAEGDPISFSDPYGLSACCPDNPSQRQLDLEVEAMEYNGTHPKQTAVLAGLGVLTVVAGFGILELGAAAAAAAPEASEATTIVGRGAAQGARAVRGETSATRAGRAAHVQFSEEMEAQGYQANRQIPGTRLRPDAIHVERGIIRELKPNNPRAIARGLVQVRRYAEAAERAFGKAFQTFIDTY
ncbi:MAG TPA: RHS repeat-associated core domain-containing protein [Longimicrobium sp.]|jgi:RHS repeat-associated protein|nr:RHS repeat-associated core domain-containing protein [Longimicrobium sp.]